MEGLNLNPRVRITKRLEEDQFQRLFDIYGMLFLMNISLFENNQNIIICQDFKCLTGTLANNEYIIVPNPKREFYQKNYKFMVSLNRNRVSWVL